MSLSEIRVNTTKTRTGVGTITYTETGPVITGIATASNFKTGSTNVHSTGVELSNINTGGSTATFGGAISGTTASFSGNVSIGGTLTYEDVTNIDSVGILTARNGIRLGATGANTLITGDANGATLTSNVHDGGLSIVPGNNNQESRINLQGKASNGTLHAWSIGASRSADRFYVSDTTNSILTILDGGNVGINQITPTADLEVAGTVGTGATIFINPPTHNTNVASIAMLKLGYKHSGGQAVGYLKLTEGGGNSFDGSLTIGVPYNQGSGNFGTRDAIKIKHSGFVGIGTDNPTRFLHVQDDSNTLLALDSTDNNADLVQSDTVGSTRIRSASGALEFYTGGDASSTNATGSGRRFNIDSNGRIELGHNASVGTGKLQVFTKVQDAIDIIAFDDVAANGGRLTFYRNRNTTYGSNTKLANDDSLGRIDFRGMNTEGTDNYEVGASIQSFVDAEPGSGSDANDMPGRLIFLTTPDGSHTAQERLRISNSGYMQMKNSAGSTFALLRNTAVADSSSLLGSIDFGTIDWDSSCAAVRSYQDGAKDKGSLRFYTQPTVGDGIQERLRITSGGSVNIGTGELTQTDRMLNVYGGRMRISGIPANSNSFEVYANSTTGQSHGVLIDAGTNASDICAHFRQKGGSNLLQIRGDGNIRIGAGSLAVSKASLRGVDIDSGGYSACIGGNVNSSGRTDGTDKLNRITSPHRTNAEEPVAMISSYNQTGTNTIYYGGGSSITNAATHHHFYTAANTTTLNGTERFRIENDGDTYFWDHQGDSRMEIQHDGDFRVTNPTWSSSSASNCFQGLTQLGSQHWGHRQYYSKQFNLSQNGTQDLISNNTAHDDIIFWLNVKGYHANRTFAAVHGTIGGYGITYHSQHGASGASFTFTAANISTGRNMLRFTSTSSYGAQWWVWGWISGTSGTGTHTGITSKQLNS